MVICSDNEDGIIMVKMVHSIRESCDNESAWSSEVAEKR